MCRIFYQRDSKTGHGERMCFSSSMAMALDYINPDAIEGDDDWYLNEVFKFGDSVSSSAQVAAAHSLGFAAEFKMDGTEELLLGNPGQRHSCTHRYLAPRSGRKALRWWSLGLPDRV